MIVGQTLHLGGQVKKGSIIQIGASYDFQVYQNSIENMNSFTFTEDEVSWT